MLLSTDLRKIVAFLKRRVNAEDRRVFTKIIRYEFVNFVLSFR